MTRHYRESWGDKEISEHIALFKKTMLTHFPEHEAELAKLSFVPYSKQITKLKLSSVSKEFGDKIKAKFPNWVVDQ